MTIDGITFDLVPLDWGVAAKLEQMGVDYRNWQDRPVAFAVGMFAVSAGLDFQDAAQHVSSHIQAGGNIDEFLDRVVAVVDAVHGTM